MAQEKENIQIPHLKGKTIEEFLTHLEENWLVDDHVGAILGERKRKPAKDEHD